MNVKQVAIKELSGNEILAKPIMSWDYQIILQEGIRLKKDYIEKLQDLNIQEVWIRVETIPSQKIVVLREDIANSAKEKVKEILERHTYHNNKELEYLTRTASEIMESMLEEEELLEKVYDMKERSSDLYEHSISVCTLSILTAIKLGLEKDQISRIGVGSLLHDLGLRYIDIQYKNRELNDMTGPEREEYKKHPAYAYRALINEDWMSPISKNIILEHHETLDGEGFPLRNKNTLPESRIVSICDTFDELICGIGRKKVRVQEAIEFLKAFQKMKFDDKIVEVFLSFTAVYPVGTLVMTNEKETGIVIGQNKGFQDRPILKIFRDSRGNIIEKGLVKDMLEIKNIFIEEVLDQIDEKGRKEERKQK